MPKFLAGCHYNEEEINQHLEKKYRILAGPNEWQQVCNRWNPEKTGRSCEGADFSWLSSKVSRTLDQVPYIWVLLFGGWTCQIVQLFWAHGARRRVCKGIVLSKEGMEGRTNGHYWCQRLMRLKERWSPSASLEEGPLKSFGSHGRPFVIIAGHGIIRSPSKISENLWSTNIWDLGNRLTSVKE